MDFSNHPLNRDSTVQQQYSNLTKLNNSTVVPLNEILKNFSDVIPNDGYGPFYAKMVRELGVTRFTELANKARAGSDTPQRLFCWMLKNNEQVR